MGSNESGQNRRRSSGQAAKLALLSGLLVATISASGAFAAPVGTTVDATTTVMGSGPSGTREIRKDSPIYSDDRLKANRTGNAQIILVDKTKIVVGPNAQIDITDYVYNDSSKTTFKSITIKATKGTFRIFTGSSKPSAFKIETPAGSIGIRG